MLKIKIQKSRKPKQCSTPVRADTTYIAVNANAHGRKHVQACLNFSLSFCLRVRAVAWRHSDYDVSRPAADYSLSVTSPAATLAAFQ